MIKIKDNVDLKELEDFGYVDLGVCYKKYEIFGTQYFINKDTREIERNNPYSVRKNPTESEIKDLIQAGLVEKISIKN